MNAHLQRGRLLVEQGRHEQALPELRQAIALEPDNFWAHCSLAVALMNVDRMQEALEAARTAVSKEPDFEYPHWVLALVLANRGDLKEAEASIRTAIELAPDDAANQGLLSRILLQMGRPQEALAAADAGLALDPSNDTALTFRARALMALGRDAEARATADVLLAESPDSAWNHQLRGDQLLAAGRHSEAQTHFVEALRLEPGMAAARVGLATCLKARSPLYGVLLRILLSMNRLGAWVWWAVGFLLFFTLRYGDAWAAKHPEWLLGYEVGKSLLWAGVILVLIANPVFDILLSFDREGRRALSEDELRATRWHLACFGMAALFAALAFVSGSTGAPKRIGVGFLFLTRIVTEAFEAPAGWVRRRMAWLGWAGVGLLLFSPVVGLAGGLGLFASGGKSGLGLLLTSVYMPSLTVLLAAFADNIREWLEKRRPDGQ